ncbi:hypothetical protein ABZZ04_02775 [Streptomyces sp. NPDC006435]|uniref:hypothetical protein n=1 Tax=Streptomyces sp. NPDC006435 TaxID=3154300 RepID=UPI0033B0AFA4
MPIPVHALAHSPLTAEALDEFLALPTAPHVPDGSDALDAEVQRRGWAWEDLVQDSFRTGYGHVLCTDGLTPFGVPDARSFLVFGEVYPVDPEDEEVTPPTCKRAGFLLSVARPRRRGPARPC